MDSHLLGGDIQSAKATAVSLRVGERSPLPGMPPGDIQEQKLEPSMAEKNLVEGSGDQPGRAAINESPRVSLKGQGEQLGDKTADIPTENYGRHIDQRKLLFILYIKLYIKLLYI
jgi:hypothetical protein